MEKQLLQFTFVWIFGIFALISVWRYFPMATFTGLMRNAETTHNITFTNFTHRTRRTPPPIVITPTAMNMLTTSLSRSRPEHVDEYVTFAGGFGDGRGLGNQIFNFATVVYVAELTGRKPTMLRFPYRVTLEEVFDLQVERFDDICPCYNFGEQRSLVYDDRLEEFVRSPNIRSQTADKSIVIGGFFQSWKYTRAIDRRLRKHLTFVPELRQYVDAFHRDSVPPNWIRGYVRVGIHIRRGDVLNKDKVEFGYTTPDAGYFHRAMKHFADLFDRVQFIVCSNDITWSRTNLAAFSHNTSTTNVTFVSDRSHGHDMALLASCDHTIISTGTYSWWAAYLAKGTTIYYSDWPRNGTRLFNMFKKADYFPPQWIGMT